MEDIVFMAHHSGVVGQWLLTGYVMWGPVGQSGSKQIFLWVLWFYLASYHSSSVSYSSITVLEVRSKSSRPENYHEHLRH